jgi:hypothetical protein
MARGFESKSVADQQAESAQGRPARSQNGVIDPALAARRRKLELSRVDIERRLAVATAPAHRQMLERALRALLDEIESLG